MFGRLSWRPLPIPCHRTSRTAPRIFCGPALRAALLPGIRFPYRPDICAQRRVRFSCLNVSMSPAECYQLAVAGGFGAFAPEGRFNAPAPTGHPALCRF
jgi:hypothetical protein